MSESKPYLSPVESIKPVNVQAELYAASQECSGLIDSMMYAEAFEQFAERLDNIAKQPHSPLLDEKTQVGVRRALGEAWKAFVKTSKNEKNVPQWQAQATVSAISPREQEEVETLEQDIPPETEKYFTALAKQAESERGHVVTFPNEASKKAALRRDIERRLEPEGSIVAQTHGTEALQRRYVASMFYDVIPLLRTQTEGYVKDLVAGKLGPVTPEAIRVHIVAFLKNAKPMAIMLSEADVARDAYDMEVRMARHAEAAKKKRERS